MAKEATNLLNVDEQTINKAWEYISRMRAIEVVNETTLMEAEGLMTQVDVIFDKIHRTAKSELDSRRQYVSHLSEQISRVFQPYEEAREILKNRINMYSQFKREIASKERYDVGNTIEQSHAQIEQEYKNQMLAERERLDKIRKEEWNKRIAGYIVDDPIELLQSVILGEVTTSIVDVREKVVLDIGRRYNYKIKIPGIRWVFKNKKGEVLDEISS